MADREIAELQQNNITRNDHGRQCLAALPLLQIHGGFILKQKHTDKLQHALHFKSCWSKSYSLYLLIKFMLFSVLW
jgi:hypothetical protein